MFASKTHLSGKCVLLFALQMLRSCEWPMTMHIQVENMLFIVIALQDHMMFCLNAEEKELVGVKG